jgi:formylglycine-generating enzyme required for sulfatase activity
MRTKLCLFLMVSAVLASMNSSMARPTLSIVPTNNQAILFWPANAGGTNGVLNATASLASPNWLSATDVVTVSYGSYVAVAVGNSYSARFFRLALVPPAADGMALVPAGWFTMGDTLDSESDAVPTNIYVSAFWMDTNLVSYGQWQGVYAYATSEG